MTDRKVCGVCNVKSLYKCPKCLIRYCSVVCYKSHQGSCVPKDVSKTTAEKADVVERRPCATINEDGMSSDSVTEELLHKLGDSPAIHAMIKNRHLVAILRYLDTTEKPEAALESAMREPIFVEFADECLRIVEPDQENCTYLDKGFIIE